MDNRTITLAMDDATFSIRLIEIARKHVKLALEHSKPQTSPERRKAIKSEIKRLRHEREAILNQNNSI